MNDVIKTESCFVDAHAKMARILIMIAAPSHFLFLIVIRFWENNFIFTAPFIIIYLMAALIQISILLYISYIVVLKMWQKKLNPDNSALPFITALADLLGSLLLAFAFFLLYSFNDPNGAISENTNTTVVHHHTTTMITTLHSKFS